MELREKHQQKLHFTTSKVPQFSILYTPTERFPIKSQKKATEESFFTPFVEASTTMNTFRLLVALGLFAVMFSCLLHSPSPLVPLSVPCHQFSSTMLSSAAALSQWIIYFDNILLYGHKLCLCLLLLTTLKELFNF